ncbi:PadR family transcriptional regulator [Pseudonocardia xishanensis]|uniref:Transcription regulator PadR N-terminal domain-containing protein n=1 Tax=Pseudonocardia xishanensis TaxID=630995 RepID=A0ABP8RNM8_9PSEU
MSATNPTWDDTFGSRFGPRFGPAIEAAFGPGFGPRGRRRRGGPHRRPPFGPEGTDVNVNIDADEPGDRPRGRRGGRGFGGPGGGRGFGPGGPGFGPGFGPGGPFGPGGRGFGPGRRGPGGRGRRGRGDVRLAVLALVAEQPRHGYEIIQEITERSGGRWKPSPGSVYPTLSQLEDEGLVSVEKTDGRRVVSLTEAGTTYVAEHREELDKVWSAFDGEEEDGPDTALWQQLAQLHAAAQQVLATGTPEQLATATETLTEARKAIYRLLAE